MPHRLFLAPLLAPLLLGGLALGARLPLPQAGSSQEAAEVRRLVDELHALRAERQALERELEAERETLGADLTRLEDDLALVRTRLRGHTATNAALKTEIGAFERIASLVEVALGAARSSALEACALLRSEIEAGLPFARDERLAQLDLYEEELRAGGELASQALVEVGAFAAEDLRLGTTTESKSGLVDLADGRRLHAYRFRLGLIQEFFVSEDGAELGVLSGGGAWRTDLTLVERAALEDLLRTARGRSAATLVPVPLAPRIRIGEGD